MSNTKLTMSHSENINELVSALAKAQAEMQPAIKDKVNPFYKSSYADLGSVWDSARPITKYGLCVIQMTEVKFVESMPPQNVLVTMLAHTSGQWIKSSLHMNPTKPDAQGVGACMTYLRRYSLAAIVGIVCDDDDGETAVGRGKAQKHYKKEDYMMRDHQRRDPAVLPPAHISSRQAQDLLKVFSEADEEFQEQVNSYLERSGIHKDFSNFPINMYERIFNSAKNKRKMITV